MARGEVLTVAVWGHELRSPAPGQKAWCGRACLYPGAWGLRQAPSASLAESVSSRFGEILHQKARWRGRSRLSHLASTWAGDGSQMHITFTQKRE